MLWSYGHSLLTATVTLCGKLELRFPSSGAFHFCLLRLEVCGTPEQHVSEVQSGDTILTSQVPDPATERSIKERVFERASAAVVQPSRRTHSILKFLLTVPAGGHVALRNRHDCSGVHDGFELLVGHTRDGSFCCTCHPRHFRPASPHWWLLPASKRDPHAPGEVRTHDCGCADEVRHSVCPFFCVILCTLGCQVGPGFDTIQSNLPLFPARNGDMFLKHQIITAHRSVIAISGTAPTMIDGIGNTRQRVGGHVCRVVGAVWLYQNLEDLHFVQLFARWSRRLSRGTSQTLRCTNKQILQLVQ